MATTVAPYGFWATNPTEKLAHWVYLLGQPLSRNRVFQNFSGEPPPPPLKVEGVGGGERHDFRKPIICAIKKVIFMSFGNKKYMLTTIELIITNNHYFRSAFHIKFVSFKNIDI